MATDEQALLRIDELEAKLNGILIYLAAREAGVELDTNDERPREFMRNNVSRPSDTRLNKDLPRAGDGYWESYPVDRIATLIEKLKNL